MGKMEKMNIFELKVLEIEVKMLKKEFARLTVWLSSVEKASQAGLFHLQEQIKCDK